MSYDGMTQAERDAHRAAYIAGPGRLRTPEELKRVEARFLAALNEPETERKDDA